MITTGNIGFFSKKSGSGTLKEGIKRDLQKIKIEIEIQILGKVLWNIYHTSSSTPNRKRCTYRSTKSWQKTFQIIKRFHKELWKQFLVRWNIHTQILFISILFSHFVLKDKTKWLDKWIRIWLWYNRTNNIERSFRSLVHHFQKVEVQKKVLIRQNLGNEKIYVKLLSDS